MPEVKTWLTKYRQISVPTAVVVGLSIIVAVVAASVLFTNKVVSDDTQESRKTVAQERVDVLEHRVQSELGRECILQYYRTAESINLQYINDVIESRVATPPQPIPDLPVLPELPPECKADEVPELRVQLAKAREDLAKI